MERKNSIAVIGKKVLCAVLLIASVVATFTKICTGFDIDEAYALALPFRGLQGDRLFMDMWEVHQTSFFLPFIFVKLYEMIFHSMDGIVVFTRVVATLIHLGISVLLYVTLRKSRWLKEKSDWALLIVLVYFNFLPKWMMQLDFSMMQLWFFTLFILLFECGKNLQGKSRGFLWFATGIVLACDVLAYPGMIALYCGAIVLLILDGKIFSRYKDMIYMTLGCAFLAIVFIGCILSYMSFSEFLQAIPKVFMDGAHQYDFQTKVMLYLSQWLEVLRQTLILMVPALLVSAIGFWSYQKLGGANKFGTLPFGFLFCAIFAMEVGILISVAGIFISWGPFRLQVRYIIQFVMAYFLLRKVEDDSKKELLKLWWLSFAAFIGVLLASNVGPTSSASYLVIGNMLFVGALFLYGMKQGRMALGLTYAVAVVFVFSLIMCKGFYMRNTEYVPGDIADGLLEMTEGPLKGVYVADKDFERFSSDYHTIKSMTGESDLVLFMGTESLCNLYANGQIVSPTTISTPAFNEQWVDYFTMYPDKQPSIIFLAKNTVDNREKFFSKNAFGVWIAKRYDVECMEETESLCIIKKK